MVRIPYIKIPSVRVGNIGPTSNIGTGGATPAPPTPITYLTQWKIVGNSEVHGNEIWSCGEYNPIDGKWHILVQPQGGSIADIALTEPLRKVNDVADTIEIPSGTNRKALVTRRIYSIIGLSDNVTSTTTATSGKVRWTQPLTQKGVPPTNNNSFSNLLSTRYPTSTINNSWSNIEGCVMRTNSIELYDEVYCTAEDKSALIAANADTEFIYERMTPTTELIDVSPIKEADSYTCVITPGAKAVSWSSFETDSE